ncbi:MAG: hypothetical protein JWO38_2304 [Gemmataceae bacterium]|nr:hypothetical protein [Gemmataceae bacterium]
MLRLFVCATTAFVAGGLFGRATAPPNYPDLGEYRLINIAPKAGLSGPEAADPNDYEAHVIAPDRKVISIPVSSGLAQVHARSRGAVEKPVESR